MSAADANFPPERELLTRFEVQKFLGKGSYGSVYRVRRLSDNKIYALKETNVKNLSQQERQEACNEIRLLASVSYNTAISLSNSFGYTTHTHTLSHHSSEL